MASIAWSEIFRTDEDRPGHWVMYDDNKQPVAEIELRRTDVGPRYRITMSGTIMTQEYRFPVDMEHGNRYCFLHGERDN